MHLVDPGMESDTSAEARHTSAPVPAKTAQLKKDLAMKKIIEQKVKIVQRNIAPRESYILCDGKYWAGLTEKTVASRRIIKQLANEIHNNHMSHNNPCQNPYC